MFGQNKNVGDPGKGRVIGDDASKSDLLISFVETKRK
jgi:hypothetical protein